MHYTQHTQLHITRTLFLIALESYMVLLKLLLFYSLFQGVIRLVITGALLLTSHPCGGVTRCIWQSCDSECQSSGAPNALCWTCSTHTMVTNGYCWAESAPRPCTGPTHGRSSTSARCSDTGCSRARLYTARKERSSGVVGPRRVVVMTLRTWLTCRPVAQDSTTGRGSITRRPGV